MRPTVLITGASRGIGKATALAYARAGYDVAITARTEVEGQRHQHSISGRDGQALPGSLATTLRDIEACGVRALALRMDLLEPASIDAAADAALEQFSRIDVLINNAIYQGSDLNARFLDLDAEVLARVWQGYVAGPVRLTQRVLQQMLKQGGGTVINVTSGAGETDPPLAAGRGGWGYAYGAAKAAVSRLSGLLAIEHGDQGIRAYTVNPGVVSTEALHATLGEDGALFKKVGAAPPEVPAQVMLWLATNKDAPAHQRCTINAQTFALQHNIVPAWPGERRKP
ncbi:MAG: SDR family oxidoreductase [Betaproteobacteria bacterium]|nr:SDR family oxidoreductase [Betaproteobacteria bacterium]